MTNSIDSFYQEIEGAFKEESFNEDINQLFISKSLIPGLEEKVASDNREFRANTKEIRKIRNENKIIENSNLEEIEKMLLNISIHYVLT